MTGLKETMGVAVAVYNLLEQDKVWVDKHGVHHEIDDMDDDYVVNVIVWLQRRADWLAFHHGFGLAVHPVFGGDDLPWEVEQDMDAEWQRQIADPWGWLDDTPLLRKLLARRLS